MIEQLSIGEITDTQNNENSSCYRVGMWEKIFLHVAMFDQFYNKIIEVIKVENCMQSTWNLWILRSRSYCLSAGKLFTSSR